MSKTKKTTPKQKKLAAEKSKKEIKSTASQKVEKAKIKEEKYFESVGRRKTAIARVRLFLQKEKSSVVKEDKSSFPPSLSLCESSVVNEKPLEEYFPTRELQQTVSAPLDLMNCPEQFKVSVKVKGGGTVSQAEAVRHGLARALVLFNSDFRKKLKKAGYLKRDPRMRERKKFGLKRARRAPQWSKR